ncbi:MAG: hypothetical protein ABR976_05020 [Terracidiphilus sp.]
MVQQIPTAVTDPTLGHAVLPWAAETGSLGLVAKALYGIDHVIVELRVAIKYQVAGRRVVGESLAQLLNNPCAGKMSGHIAVEYPPPVMRNDEEAVENAKRERRQGEEIHRGDSVSMIAQPGCPSFRRLRALWRFPHPTQNGPLRNIEAKYIQFAVNARRTPGCVLGNHAENEIAQLPAGALSSHTDSMSRKPSPIQLEPCPRPPNDCLYRHSVPSRPKPPQGHAKQFVSSRKARLRMLLSQNCELLPKSQVFQEQIKARAKESLGKNRQKPQQAQHGPSFTCERVKLVA